MYMLDTNMCIYIIKNKPEKVKEKLFSTHFKDICISSITLSELYFGVEKSNYSQKNKIALELFLSPFKVLPFGNEAAITYGKVRALLEKNGTPIGAMDYLIAAHALSENLVLVTNNEKEFVRIPNLKVENWAK